ncbi:MAG: hypothetical protein H0X45_16210, partial [Planctomycetes bacterium]|nr:hypothetical protein [Planctomycetota bacterium]
FETAPSAPVDASKYPIAGPMLEFNTTTPATFERRMEWFNFTDALLYAFRNPEKAMAFTQRVDALPTGANVAALVGSSGYEDNKDRGVAGAPFMSGVYGADRNWTKTLDRGPIPASVRLRAQLVARFDFYDPRLALVVK